MSSRIWVDARDGEGVWVAEKLRRLGFKVEVFVPVCAQHKTHEPHASKPSCANSDTHERIEFPATSRVW